MQTLSQEPDRSLSKEYAHGFRIARRNLWLVIREEPRYGKKFHRGRHDRKSGRAS